MLTVTVILTIAALLCGIWGAVKQAILYTAVGVILLSVVVLISVLPK